MIPGILFLHGRRDQVILRVIVDHRLREDLVPRIALAGGELVLHEGGDLIHIERNIRDLSGIHVIQVLEISQKGGQDLLCLVVHRCLLPGQPQHAFSAVCPVIFQLQFTVFITR